MMENSDAHVKNLEMEIAWQEKFSQEKEKYLRLYESYRKTQFINQSLEDKLLKYVDQENQAKMNVLQLQRETERYKNDMNLVINLLQCNPKSFISPNLKSVIF